LALATGNEPCGADALVYAEVVHELEAYARAEPQQTATQSTLRSRSKKIPWYSSDRRYCGLPANKSCADLKKDLEMAELSKCAYGKVSCEPKFELVPPKDSVVYLQADRYDDKGFNAQLYRDPRANKYILVFRGTDNVGDDWTANKQQSKGKKSRQYGLAIQLARDVRHLTKGSELEFSGHSLGGGLATVAAFETAGQATVFNAAAVQSKTADLYNLTDKYNAPDQHINHIHTKSDPLTRIQDPSQAGVTLKIQPVPGKTTKITNPDVTWMNATHQNSAKFIDGFFPVVWHSMSAVIHVLESVIKYNCP